MKKAALILSAFLFIFVTGCSQKIPEGLTQESYDTGVKALETIDQYLDGEIGKDEVMENLGLYSDLLNGYWEKADKQNKSTVFLVYIHCYLAYYSAGDDDAILLLEDRNNLAERLGKPTR